VSLPPGTIAINQEAPTGIALDDTYVYWANLNAGTVVRCPLAGCGGANPTVLASDIIAPHGIDVNGSELYWLSSPEPVDAGQPMMRVFSCSKQGCSGAPTLLLELPVDNQAHGIHIQGGSIYYAAWPYFGRCSTSGCLAGGPVELGARPAVSVTADATFLYLGERFGVYRCDLPDCTNEIGFGGAIEALDLAVDSTHLYFANNDAYVPATDGAFIGRCPLAGCDMSGPEVLVSEDVSPYGIAVDDERIYYTNFVHGTVLSRPK
jgi:hypothetical protein